MDTKYNYLHKTQNKKFIIYDSIANFKVRMIDLDLNLGIETEDIYEYSNFIDSLKNEK